MLLQLLFYVKAIQKANRTSLYFGVLLLTATKYRGSQG
jgi:hypothetical protein